MPIDKNNQEDIRARLQSDKKRAREAEAREQSEELAQKDEEFKKMRFGEGRDPMAVKRSLIGNQGVLKGLLSGNQGDPRLGKKNKDGTMNYLNPETGLYQKEKPTMSPINQLDRMAGKETYTTPEGKKLKRKDYDPYKEVQKERGKSAGGGAKAAGKKGLGKVAGAGISEIAEQGGMVSSAIIYGLALLNDIPDLADPLIEFFTVGSGVIIDFIFDVVVFIGFRYFLREHINVPAIKYFLYSAAFLEFLDVPVISIDILPFWTLCAWLVLRKIKDEQNIQQARGVSRRKAAKIRQSSLEKKHAYYNKSK